MKKPQNYIYPAVFNYDDKEIAVTFPDLDVATSGIDRADAFSSARELLGVVMSGLEADGEVIPAPSMIRDLALAPGEEAALVDVFMPVYRDAERQRSVSRTVTLPAWLNAEAMARKVNFSQVLQAALKDYLKTAG